MCGSPDIPTTPERQDARVPDRSATGASPDEGMRRRRGYAALIRTASGQGGDMTPLSTTASKATLG